MLNRNTEVKLLWDLLGFKNKNSLESSEKTIHSLEKKLVQGNLNESSALKLLQLYQMTNRHRDIQKMLDLIMANNLRSKALLEFAVNHYLRKRDYQKSYRLCSDLCFYYDRKGRALLQLGRIAILVSEYSHATRCFQEYIQHNGSKEDVGNIWLGHCYLRQRNFKKALSYFNKGNRNLMDPNILTWLSVLDGKRNKPEKHDWFGRKTRPMKRIQTLKWKNDIINCQTKFHAKSLSQIDEWINRGTYISDDRLYGEVDVWRIPSEFEEIKRGDCEDFALWTWVQLLRMNLKARFMLGGLYSEELNHAWVCIYSRSGVKVLECTPQDYNVPIHIKNAPEYTPILSIDRSLTWYQHGK